jgi:hypothetical protein
LFNGLAGERERAHMQRPQKMKIPMLSRKILAMPRAKQRIMDKTPSLRFATKKKKG